MFDVLGAVWSLHNVFWPVRILACMFWVVGPLLYMWLRDIFRMIRFLYNMASWSLWFKIWNVLRPIRILARVFRLIRPLLHV